ncbi:MAG: septum formation initiator family protein [Caldilineaceae bacterium]
MNMPHASNLPKTTQRGAQVLFFVLATLCLLFVMSYASRLNEFARVQHEAALLEQKMEDAERRQAELLAYQDYVQSEAYVAQVGREELNMVQPDDNVVVIIDANGQAQMAPNRQENDLRANIVQLPIWRQWFNLFVQQSPAPRFRR